MRLSGRVWKFGDALGVLDMLPARYDDLRAGERWQDCAQHLFEDVAPDFVAAAQPGDVIVAGGKLGTGHVLYHRGTVLACRAAGIAALLTESADAYFQRAAIDAGLLVWTFRGIGTLLNDGEHLDMELATGAARNADTGAAMRFKPLAPLILDILAAGGTFQWGKDRAAQQRVAPSATEI